MARIVLDGVEYVDSAETCELLGIKPATLYAYVSRGRIRSFKRGGRSRYYPAADIDSLLQLESTRPVHIPLVDDWMPYTG